LEVPFDRRYQFRAARRWQTAVGNRREMRRSLRSFRPDVVFAWSQLRLTLAPVLEATAVGIPLVWSFNDANLLSYRDAPFSKSHRGRIRWLLSRWFLPGSSPRALSFAHAAVISNSLREDLVAGGLPLQGATLIHQGIPTDQFPPRQDIGAIASPMRVCYIGQLQSYKGVHVVLNAVSIYASRHGPESVSLTIVGSGPADYVASLRAISATTNAKVAILDRMPREQLSATYRAHDVFVFPSSWREPFGLTHLEAMASGLPVVSTMDGGQAEFLRPEENCLACPREDAEALCGCLERLKNDPSLAERIALAGRELVLEEYTTSRYLRELEEFVVGSVKSDS